MSADESGSTLADSGDRIQHMADASAEVAMTPTTSNNSQPNGSVPRDTDTSSRRLQYVRSYSDGHGFTRTSEDDERKATDVETGPDPEKEFEVKWDGEDDPMNPRSMNRVRKWIIVVIVSTSSLCVTCTSSLYTSTYGQITEEFHCSQIVATLGLSLFVMGLGIGPMLLGPLSEVNTHDD